MLRSSERADPCAGCNGRNVVDYALEEYGIGVKTTGISADHGNGNMKDGLGEEYRNWPNVLKLTWPDRLVTGEHGVNTTTSGVCCRTGQELYWAVLNALDKHLWQLHFLSGDIAQPGTGADEARQLFARYAGRNLDDTPDVWIVFRDTLGTFYPDGDNGAAHGHPPGRIPCCRWLPNYEWFIYQRNPQRSQVVRNDLPDSFKSLSARSDSHGPLALDVEDLWMGSGQPPLASGGCATYNLQVDYLNSGTDQFAIRYSNQNGTVKEILVDKTGTSQWASHTMQLDDLYLNNGLPGGGDLELFNPDSRVDIFHKVRIALASNCPGGPEPSITATPTQTGIPGTPTPTATPADLPQTLTLQPDDVTYDGVSDTYLSSWDLGNINFGDSTLISVRPFQIWHGLLRMELAGLLPAHALIQQARLDLYVVSRSNDSNWAHAEAYTLNRPWIEAEATWNQASRGNPWQIPGAEGVPEDRAALPLDTQRLDQTETWVDFDVTETVQGWVSGNIQNHGLVLRGGTGSGNVRYSFASSQYRQVEVRPRLVISYVIPTPTPTATTTATRTPTATTTPTATPTRPSGIACLPTTFATVRLGDNPKGVAASVDRVYVALYTFSRLAILQASDASLQGFENLVDGQVNGVAVLDDRVYTANRNSATLSVSDSSNGALIGSIAVGNLPWGVAAAADRVYVVNFADNTVTVINAPTEEVVATVPVPALPAFITALPDRAYVTHINGYVSIVGRDGSLLELIQPGPSDLWGITQDPANSRLYLSSRSDQRIVVLSSTNNMVLDNIDLAGPPYALAYNPDTGHLFAVDATQDLVYVIDTGNNNELLGSVPVGPQDAEEGGQGMAVAGNKVFVANWQDRSLTVLDDTTCLEETRP
jgi:YVTN family beta-propeller protein